MLSVIIPSLNAESGLARSLGALIPGAVSGLIREVIIADGGSSDATMAIAEDAGCVLVAAPPGRGAQLARGASAARAEWLLFLHADTALAAGWETEAAHFMAGNASEAFAGVFRFALDDFRPAARRLEFIVAMRCKLLALPYGDQGLLIHRRLYDWLGGYRELPLMEDVDLIRRIGRKRLIYFRSRALTSASRYIAAGYVLRALRNMVCLALYFLRLPPRLIARLYG